MSVDAWRCALRQPPRTGCSAVRLDFGSETFRGMWPISKDGPSPLRSRAREQRIHKLSVNLAGSPERGCVRSTNRSRFGVAASLR